MLERMCVFVCVFVCVEEIMGERDRVVGKIVYVFVRYSLGEGGGEDSAGWRESVGVRWVREGDVRDRGRGCECGREGVYMVREWEGVKRNSAREGVGARGQRGIMEEAYGECGR